MEKRNIEQHHTRCRIFSKDSGIMMPLWKDYEFDKIKATYVYSTTCRPGTTKGPHLHTKRNGLLSFVQGKLLLIYKENKDAKYEEMIIDADKKPEQVYIPKNMPYCILNIGKTDVILISICDYAWRPNDGETIIPDFSDYDFDKWLKD